MVWIDLQSMVWLEVWSWSEEMEDLGSLPGKAKKMVQDPVLEWAKKMAHSFLYNQTSLQQARQRIGLSK